MNGNGKVAVGYVRVSTIGQAVEGISLEAQRGQIETWCKGNGFSLADVHVDAGLSGGRADNRPALQKAISEACKNKGALVVYSLSRLARSTKDTLSLAEVLDQAGADLVSLTERIDTTNASGKMVFRMLAVLSEFERDLVSERTRAALAYKRCNGERVGTVPFGYQLDVDGVRLLADFREQEIIALVNVLREQGLTYRAIAGELERRGYEAKNGGRWYASTVRNLCLRATVAA